MNSNNVFRNFKFNEGANLSDLNIVDFFVLSVTKKSDKLRKHIPSQIKCSINNVSTIFKLESASITITNTISNIAHAVTGIICNGEYYIYDPHNQYFKLDWTNLNKTNTQQILNYYMIIYTANQKTINNNTIIYSTNANYINPKIDIYIEFATYYNTNLNLKHNVKNCNPSRPK